MIINCYAVPQIPVLYDLIFIRIESVIENLTGGVISGKVHLQAFIAEFEYGRNNIDR